MTVRIIRSSHEGSFDSRVHRPVQIVRREIQAAEIQAAKRVEDAEREATRVVTQARQQADQIRQQAESEGLSLGRAEAIASLLEVNLARVAAGTSVVQLAVMAARVAAERAVGETIATSDHALSSWIRTSLGSMIAARKIALCAAPNTAARLAQALPLMQIDAVLEVRVDPSMLDGLVHASSALGEAQLDVSTQCQHLIDALLPVIRDRLRG